MEKVNALKILRELHNKALFSERTALETFVPELKESKEEKTERILHSISSKISFHLRDIFTEEEFQSFDTWSNAWLEKQGTPNQTSIWKHWKDGIAGNGEGKQIYLIKYGHTYSLSSCLCFECDYIELSELDKLMLEKQGKQNDSDVKDYNSIDPHFAKPIDKVEPKFKIGDVVRLKYGDGLEWLVKEKHEDGNYTIACADRDDCVLLDDKWELVKQKSTKCGKIKKDN